MDATAYLSQLLALLPPGAALLREPDARLARLLGVPAAELARVDGRAGALLDEADPRTTAEMLADWERALGLPDECSAPLTLVEQRRAAVLARLTERFAPTPAAIEAVSLAYGVRASVTEYREHTCEMDCETPVTGEPWAHAFTVWGSGRVVTDATCEDDCEQPLRAWSTLPHECAVRRLAPAHAVPLFDSFTDEWDFMAGLPAGATFTRAGSADRINERGATESMGPDVPRFGYQASLTYNEAPNPWADGTVAGIPGTAPTGWTIGAVSGWSREILPVAEEDGMQAFRVRLFAPPGSGAANNYHFRFIPSISLLAGETWSAGAYVKLLGGDFTGWTLRVFIGNLAAGSATVAAPTAAPLATQMRSVSRVLGANEPTAAISVALLTPAGSVGGDVTLAIGLPVLNRGGAVLHASVPPATLGARRNGIPQYGLLGLMVEAGAGETLRLAVPDGLYTATIEAATPAGAVASYAASGLLSANGSLRFDWPASATLAGANHLRRLILRKVA